jgi:hypothetical protein
VHWGWVESRIAVLGRSSNRRFGALLLNTAVFAAMGATIVSGLVVSKVVVPNHLTPESYLHWHSVHESAATFTVIFLGLHLAFNWDRIVGSARPLLASRGHRGRSNFGLSPEVIGRRLASILVACAVLSVIVWAGVRVTPHNDKVMFIHVDGTRELAAPPPEITMLRQDSVRPAPALGAPRFLVSFMLLVVVAIVGRRLLTLRRGRRRAQRHITSPSLLAAPAPNEPD